jgi:hypothetical protein
MRLAFLSERVSVLRAVATALGPSPQRDGAFADWFSPQSVFDGLVEMIEAAKPFGLGGLCAPHLS